MIFLPQLEWNQSLVNYAIQFEWLNFTVVFSSQMFFPAIAVFRLLPRSLVLSQLQIPAFSQFSHHFWRGKHGEIFKFSASFNLTKILICRKKAQLSVVSVQTTDIPPKEIVTYAKQTQTAASGERGGNIDQKVILKKQAINIHRFSMVLLT